MRFHVNILSIIIIDDAHRFRESRVQKRPEMKLQRPEVLTQPPHFDGLIGRGKRAPPALGPVRRGGGDRKTLAQHYRPSAVGAG
jgi:hypothetical protein